MIYPDVIFRTDTEIWDFESNITEIINPTLRRDYTRDIDLFAVEVGFCRKT